MPAYRIDVAYDGSGFRGYAAQTGQRTVQGELERALAACLDVVVTTSVAGRTDAGVHARAQVVSFDHEPAIDDLARLRRRLDGLLGPEISVVRVSQQDDGFDARFSALWRRYRYQIDTADAADPLTRAFVWHVGRRLQVERMAGVTGAFLGEKDFSSFCRTVEGRSNVRRVMEMGLSEKEGIVTVWVQANAFCHQMVRSIVGFLYDIGRGYTDPATVQEVIAARDRGRVVTVAPPHGLTLWSVGYGP